MQLLIIMGVVVVMWCGSFIEPVMMPEPGTYAPLYGLLYDWMGAKPLVATLVGLMIMLLEAMLLNEMLYERKMVAQNTLMPALIYVILMSGVKAGQTVTPILMVNLMMLLALRNIMKTSNVSMTLNMTFGTATYIALATMFYMPSALMIVPLLLMFPVYQLYSWRDWVVMILGLLAPYIPLTAWFMMKNELWGAYAGMWVDLLDVHLAFGGNVLNWICSGFMMLYIIVMVVVGLELSQNHPTAFQKNATAIALPMLGGALMLAYDTITPLNTQLFASGVAFMATIYYASVKRKIWMYDASIIMLIVVAMVNIYI